MENAERLDLGDGWRKIAVTLTTRLSSVRRTELIPTKDSLSIQDWHLCAVDTTGFTRQPWLSMRRHLPFALVAISVLSIVPLDAQTPAKDISASGNRYLEVCSSTEKPQTQLNEMDFLNLGLCHGFMLGFNDGVGTAISILQLNDSSLSYLKNSMEDIKICYPEGVENGQLIRLVLKYIRDHPEQAHEPAAVLVVKAELNAFPCAMPTRTPVPKPKQ